MRAQPLWKGGPLEVKDNSNAELMPWAGNKWVFSVWRLLHSFTRTSLQQPIIEMDVDGQWWKFSSPIQLFLFSLYNRCLTCEIQNLSSGRNARIDNDILFAPKGKECWYWEWHAPCTKREGMLVLRMTCALHQKGRNARIENDMLLAPKDNL